MFVIEASFSALWTYDVVKDRVMSSLSARKLHFFNGFSRILMLHIKQIRIEAQNFNFLPYLRIDLFYVEIKTKKLVWIVFSQFLHEVLLNLKLKVIFDNSHVKAIFLFEGLNFDLANFFSKLDFVIFISYYFHFGQ